MWLLLDISNNGCNSNRITDRNLRKLEIEMAHGWPAKGMNEGQIRENWQYVSFFVS